MEKLGVLCGIIGAFVVALGYPLQGYPLFTVSSAALIYSAMKQKNSNLLMLQTTFLAANILGIFQAWMQ